MNKLTHRLFGGPLRLGALGPGPPGQLDKTALDSPLPSWSVLPDASAYDSTGSPLMIRLSLRVYVSSSSTRELAICRSNSNFEILAALRVDLSSQCCQLVQQMSLMTSPMSSATRGSRSAVTSSSVIFFVGIRFSGL